MARTIDSPLNRLAERRLLRLWSRAAEGVESMDPESLRAIRARARRMRREADHLILRSEGRLGLPPIGSSQMPRPLGADLLWRPDAWRWPILPRGHAGTASPLALSPGITLFHDCPLCEVAVRQVRNTREDDLAPFSLTLETLGFRGTFLSLALDLPPEAAAGLGPRHVISLILRAEFERPLSVLARLNLRHGPNTDQIAASLPGDETATADFDLATTALDGTPVRHIWLDLIFNAPDMSAVRLRDLTMSRRTRADL
jgi:hypothetical protein